MSDARTQLSAIDLTYYAPHIFRIASDADDVRVIVENDSEQLVSSLRSFLVSSAAASIPGFFQLPTTDDAGDNSATLARKQFRLYELIDDITASHDSDFLASPAPSQSSALHIRPSVACTVTPPWIEVVDHIPGLIDNFSIGHTIRVRTSIGSSIHEIVQIDGQRLLLDDADALIEGIEGEIDAVVVADANRTLRVRAFHDWRVASIDGPPVSATITSFNESLYRLLYAPSDPNIAHMGAEELYAHHVDRPGSIGNLQNLLDAAHSTASSDQVRVDSRLVLQSGAAIDFAPPMNGTIVGLMTTEKTGDGYCSDVGVDEDAVVPTSAAVHQMIASAVPEPDAENYTRYLQVHDVLYAGGDFGGVHCPTTLSVDRDIRCGELTAEKDVIASSLRATNAGVSNSLSAHRVSSDTLDIAGGVVNATSDGLTVSGSLLRARGCQFYDVDVERSVRVAEDVEAARLQADRIDVRDSIVCRDACSTDSIVHGRLDVGGHIRASSLEVGGLDVARELRSLRALLTGAST